MTKTLESLKRALECHRAGKLDDAQRICREILQTEPQNAHALHLLGAIEHQYGRHIAAVDHLTRAVMLDKQQVAFHATLASAQLALGRTDEGVRSLREVLRLRPNHAKTHNDLGVALASRGELEEAAQCLKQALRLEPNRAPILNNLGNILKNQGRIAEAIECFRAALRAEPRLVQARYNLANSLKAQGKLDEAIAQYRAAVRIAPDFAEGHCNLGLALREQDKPDEAIACYREALRIQPDFIEACNNLAVLHAELSQPDLSLEYCKKSLELAPTLSTVYGNMAIAFFGQGRVADAVAACRKAVELNPDGASEHTNYLYALNFQADVPAAQLFAEHVAWARRHADPLSALAPPHAHDRTANARLRVGYVSPYFRHHAVNYFTEPMLLAHDHEQFEIFCYSDVAHPDAITERIKAASDGWRETARASDSQIAQMVRDDRIDILLDLTGHMGGSRLLAFARKPSPIQVTYIGYQNTTGMSAMDYRLTDARADPPGLTDQYYTERLVRLPRAFFCYKPFAEAPDVTPLPALAAGYVTFGSFNNLMKVTPQTIAAWLEILARVPRSRLLVLAYRDGYFERHLHGLAARRGIDAQRIELFDRCSTSDYLRLQQQADIALDPFPFNGHTTTCDSVWMGLPVVMLEGDRYASRFGGSVLANVGLEDMISRTPSEYIDIAVALAGDLPRLAALRTGLRARMASSVLLDHQGFTRNLEAAYRRMWRDWCATRQTSG